MTDTITLTREEAQQVLDALEDYEPNEAHNVVETLRARLSAPEPEPVAWMQPDKEHLSLWNDEWHVVPLYTAPPQREWQGLTDEERTYLAWESNNGTHCVAMTEAKLKEKNNG